MLEQRSAEKERALQNEVGHKRGLRHPKMTPCLKPGMKRERDLKPFSFGGGGIICEISGAYLLRKPIGCSCITIENEKNAVKRPPPHGDHHSESLFFKLFLDPLAFYSIGY